MKCFNKLGWHDMKNNRKYSFGNSEFCVADIIHMQLLLQSHIRYNWCQRVVNHRPMHIPESW